jgi:hypothetical protein
VKVVADSQALVRYLVDPARLSEPALDALLAAEDSDGVIVSAATLADLWYASQKTSSAPIAPGVFEHIQDTVQVNGWRYIDLAWEAAKAAENAELQAIILGDDHSASPISPATTAPGWNWPYMPARLPLAPPVTRPVDGLRLLPRSERHRLATYPSAGACSAHPEPP